MKTKNLLFTLSIILMSIDSLSQRYNIKGKWLTEEEDAIIKIFKENDGSFSGEIYWMKFPNDENGNPKTDPLNKDKSLRSRNRKGMIIMNNFIYNSNLKWIDGEIYDPKNGKTYSGTINMVSENLLELRGYVGITWFGRTSQWSRIEEPNERDEDNGSSG
ncbi:DUF2147 domain-containing protein [bacterium]|nr:DUF2147 domain-containing protein [bacterium]